MLRIITACLLLVGCAAPPPSPADPAPGARLERRGDEIVVAGQLFHTGTPVVLWSDPGGYDGYRAHCWDDPAVTLPTKPAAGCDTPQRYSLGRDGRPPQDWTLAAVRDRVRQFVLHYDVAGSARRCFHIIHDRRGLSVHFLLDLDGTLYQTLDLKERARHAGPANDASVGIEIAHPGYLTPGTEERYRVDAQGPVFDPLPTLGATGLPPGFLARPRRPAPIVGAIHGREYRQYDFTAEQYRALAHLALSLERVLGIPVTVPRDEAGVRMGLLEEEERAGWEGLLAHWHISGAKVDPGPAFDWEHLERLVEGLR